jgi:thioredoxin 1
MVIKLIIGIGIGVAIGAVMGSIGKCDSGGCPLTANPKRGALIGGLLGLLITLSSARVSNEATLSRIEESTRQGIVKGEQTMSKVIDFTESSFEKETEKGITLVDFWASWCGPCRLQLPILERVSEKVGDRVKVGKVNVDDCPEIANRFGVQSIPTLIILKDGKEVSRHVGVTQETVLLDAVEKA